MKKLLYIWPLFVLFYLGGCSGNQSEQKQQEARVEREETRFIEQVDQTVAARGKAGVSRRDRLKQLLLKYAHSIDSLQTEKEIRGIFDYGVAKAVTSFIPECAPKTQHTLLGLLLRISSGEKFKSFSRDEKLDICTDLAGLVKNELSGDPKYFCFNCLYLILKNHELGVTEFLSPFFESEDGRMRYQSGVFVAYTGNRSGIFVMIGAVNSFERDPMVASPQQMLSHLFGFEEAKTLDQHKAWVKENLLYLRWNSHKSEYVVDEKAKAAGKPIHSLIGDAISQEELTGLKTRLDKMTSGSR